MKMHDLNSEQQDVILLIHPMLSSAPVMRSLLCPFLGSSYRFLIPDLAAHGTASCQTYQSAAQEAQAIAQYAKTAGISSIRLGLGASMGGIVLMELLNHTPLQFGHLCFEGTSFSENSPLLEWGMKALLLTAHHGTGSHPDRDLRRVRTLYGKDATPAMARQFAAMDRDSLRNIARDCTHVQLPFLTPKQQKCCTFSYGSQDAERKKGKKYQAIKYPDAEWNLWPGYGHCKKLFLDPEGYANHLKTYL